jgi:hypothetical protein
VFRVTGWRLPLLIGLLGLVFFAPLVLHPTEVLYSNHSDFLAEHLPAKHFLARSFQETGELPLWCPYIFAGVPFVSDIQVGMFYPLHWPLYFLPEALIGPAMSWLIVFHVLLAGWCMVAYARSQGLHDWAALTAAIGYMFAGRWLLHVLGGGFYVLIGLAWLPLAALLLDGAVRRGSALWATGAGAVFALIGLSTHPQWTFYAGVFLALWSLAPAVERAGFFGDAGARSWRRISRALACWLMCGMWAAAVAAALAAVQLLPTLEAAQLSSRGEGVSAEAAWTGGLQSFLFLIGPTLSDQPFNLQWEDRGGFGLLWLFAAALAPLLCRGRVRFQAGLCLLLFIFAFGGSAFVQWSPGFRLFRQPARMLLVAGLPIAYLAGATTQALFEQVRRDAQTRARCRRLLLRFLVAALILCGGYAIRRAWWEHEQVRFHPYWLTLAATVPAMFWLLGRDHAWPAGWTLILLIDLWGLAWPLVAVRSEAEIYAPSACVERLLAGNQEHARVLDRDPDDRETGTPLGRGVPLALLYRVEAVRGYNPLDVRRFKEYLQFIGGREGELRPFEGNLTFPLIGNVDVVNQNLVDVLGVRYGLLPADQRPPGPGWRRISSDANPVAYDFVAGGRRPLGSFALYENPDAFARAFVVPRARPLPLKDVLDALKYTDLRQEALLENWANQDLEIVKTRKPRAATITKYQPNRVVVELQDGDSGYLVLTDVWYPGWSCTVDGVPESLYRADYLFRAAAVSAGRHEVVFTFSPYSYQVGKWISLSSLGVVAGIGVLGALWRVRRGHGALDATVAPGSLTSGVVRSGYADPLYLRGPRVHFDSIDALQIIARRRGRIAPNYHARCPESRRGHTHAAEEGPRAFAGRRSCRGRWAIVPFRTRRRGQSRLRRAGGFRPTGRRGQGAQPSVPV